MKIRQVKESDNPHLSKMIKKVFEEHDAPKNGTVYSDPTTDCLYETFQIEKFELYQTMYQTSFVVNQRVFIMGHTNKVIVRK